MKKRNNRQNQSAFTLIETLIALLILIVGLLAVAQLFIFSTYSNVFSQNTTIELKCLESVMEELNSINDWDPATTGGKKIAVGGTVVMATDQGGQLAAGLPASSTTGPDQAHIRGVVLNQVLNSSGRLLYYTPEIIDVTSTKWNQRRFEVRWQVVGYNSANQFMPPSTLNLTDAYSCGTCSTNQTPDFASMISSPTPMKGTEQTSVYVIMRIAPIADDAKVTSRLQIATVLINPEN